MSQTAVVYRSSDYKTEEQAECYLKTHQSPHRYLAYRDIPEFIRKFVKGNQALDYGAGTGFSTSFLYDLGLDIMGIDISLSMLEKARTNFPYIHFHNVNDLIPKANFDLVFSSFVLLELSSKCEIVRYLSSCGSFLKKDGILICITGSEQLFSPFREWMTFNSHFKENRNLRSGDIAKIELQYPKMEFHDYYWKTTDYLDCFQKAELEVLSTYHPLGSLKDPYEWKDERSYSPFTIFLAKQKPS